MASDQSATLRPPHPKLAASTNLAIKFLLELAALALLAYWGAVAGSGVVGVILAVVAPAAMVAVWGMFAAPRAARRFSTRPRIALEMGIFAVACVAGYEAGAIIVSTAFAVIAFLNAVGMTLLRQWAD